MAEIESGKELLANRGQRVYRVGECMESTTAVWRDVASYCGCGTMVPSVKAAVTDASEGEWVLLRPGCDGFDRFPDRVELGDYFEAIVRQLER
ncbi:MAG: hypothetical protein HQ523_09050 [Lentisphaerae bacterium]|nr:hypothetical protein [Lentisphaerota bacterium]